MIDVATLNPQERAEWQARVRRLLRGPKRGRPAAPPVAPAPTAPRPTASPRVHPDQRSPIALGNRVQMLTGTYPTGLVIEIKGTAGREQYKVLFGFGDYAWAGRLEFQRVKDV